MGELCKAALMISSTSSHMFHLAELCKLIKLYLLITFIDDACDIYGSTPEVAPLLDCLERMKGIYFAKIRETA